ncbi:MAG: sensor histidine kinase [Candidatus Limnocylindria bacterium]
MSGIRRELSARGLLVDVLIALGLTALSLFALAVGARDLGPSGPLNLTLLLLQTLPLALRRIVPIAVLLIVFGAIAAQIAIVPVGEDLRSSGGPLVALYTIGERVPRRWGLPLLAGVLVLMGALMSPHVGLPDGLQSLIQTELFLVAAWYLGDLVRIRGLYTQALEEKAELMGREREQRAKHAVLEERERIARELHDAVTHHVSVIVIQAGGALRALDQRPAEARTALEAIDRTGRLALTDMRRMLGILGEGETQEPMPGLDRLGDLLEQVRSAGLSVELSILGDRRPLDPGLELSAYRIIQEGLTNSLKHAGGGRARVAVSYQSGALEISIDDVRGPEQAEPMEPAHDGRGLVGMRERVAMFRGTFAAEATSSGFRVLARLPVDEAVVP